QDRDYFYNSLDHAGISKHATPLKDTDGKGLKEDAVDTNLVFNATKDFYQNNASYEYLVLFAGDSDFVPLTRGLKNAEAVKVCVVYMDFNDANFGKTKASSELLESADFTIDFSNLQKTKLDCFDKINETLSNDNSENNNDEVLDSDKFQNSETIANPFTLEQISQALIKTQKIFCKGQNEFVLVSQVGIQLKGILGKKVHGKLMPTLKNSYQDKFLFEGNSKLGSEKIKFKN
ncbi:MAG: NYN domain-containing protein, partial [Treponema sp.]|nr:NYN domain-containing protein [Treponema sp.]